MLLIINAHDRENFLNMHRLATVNFVSLIKIRLINKNINVY